MGNLTELPGELLLDIAFRIVSSGCQSDLCSLALTCQSIRFIAQDVLFQNPTVVPPWKADNSNKAPQLARSLLERPDLARLVKNLTIPSYLSSRPGPSDKTHMESILGVETPKNINSFAASCLDTMRMQMHMSNNSVVGVRTGYVVLCLALMPALECLTLPAYDRELRPAREFPITSLFAWTLRPEHLRDLPAFRNLKSLTTNCPLPWFVVALPNLTSVHFGLHRGCKVISNFPEQCTSLGIRSLTVDIDASATVLPYPAKREFYYVANLMYHTTQLEVLSLRIGADRRLRFDHSMSFTVLMNFLPPHDTLETLKIDTVDIGGWVEKRFRSLRSLKKFSGLRRVVLPQEALVDWLDYTFTEIPRGIQEIGIIDSNQNASKWAFQVSEKRLDFPELRKISLWCNRLSTPLQDYDYSMYIPVRVGSRERTPSIENIYHNQSISERVWERVQEMGIVVEKHDAQERLGWR